MQVVVQCVCLVIVLVIASRGQAETSTLFVSNFGNTSVTAYNLTTRASLGTRVAAGPEIIGSTGLRITPDGEFILAGQVTNSIARYAANGTLVKVFDPANTSGLNSPQGITFGPDDKLYVASGANDKILVFDPVTGDFIKVFSDVGTAGHCGPVDVVFGPDSNLYVPCFDVGVVIKMNGQTGSVMGETAGPPGKGLGSAVLGSDGNIYVTTIDLNDFTGEVYRYSVSTGTLTPHIPAGSGGLTSAGGIAVSINGDLLVSDLLFDQNFIDIGSRILQCLQRKNREPVGSGFISSGSDLNIPFFMTTVHIGRTRY